MRNHSAAGQKKCCAWTTQRQATAWISALCSFMSPSKYTCSLEADTLLGNRKATDTKDISRDLTTRSSNGRQTAWVSTRVCALFKNYEPAGFVVLADRFVKLILIFRRGASILHAVHRHRLKPGQHRFL
jgi:hypothetical protein